LIVSLYYFGLIGFRLLGGLFHRKQAEEFRIYLVGDLPEVFRIFLEVEVVAIYDDELAFVVLDPLLVAVVESLQVVDADALLEVASSTLDVAYEGRDAATDVNHEVGEFHQANHEVEEVGVVVEVSVAHHADVVQVRCEDLGILEDGTVLDDSVLALGYFHNIMESLVEEVYLEIERPSLHILVVVGEIWIVIDWLEVWLPAVSFAE